MNNYFRLFACCLPVAGNNRAIICDCQRASYLYIPLGLYEILTLYSKKSISEIKTIFDNESDNTIDEYFAYLIDNEYGFWCNTIEELNEFPDIDLGFETPEIINNAIIDLNEHSNYNILKFITEIAELRCKFVDLRIYNELSFTQIKELISSFKNSSFRNIDVYLKYTKELSNESIYEEILIPHSYIGEFFIHSSPFNKNYTDIGYNRIHYIKNTITNSNCCGKNNNKSFVVNLDFFNESCKYNNCLNKKISVDVSGNIKNCPSMSKSYGSIDNTKLIDVIAQKDFLELWEINKDKIATCRDCEYRYICSDCRAYINDNMAKPLKCNYNPSDNTWNRK